MKITQLKDCFAKATITFTALTAIFLLSLIWEVFGRTQSDVLPRLVATAITLAAFSFVLFLVASFSKK